MKVITPAFEKLVEKFNLDTEGQKKLIELLLIVGSILVGLKLPENMIWIFMLFVLLAILYYITILKGSRPNSLVPLLVSCTFTGIITTILVMNMNVVPYLKVIIFTIYYAAFTIIIWVALIKR